MVEAGTKMGEELEQRLQSRTIQVVCLDGLFGDDIRRSGELV
jgi:hypothetical protein